MNTGTPQGDQSWTLEVDAQRIAWLTLDVRDAAVNSLSRDVVAALDAELAGIEREPPAGVAVTSAKSGFIAGADIREFERVRTPDDALPLIRAAQAVIARLERLPCPTVAAINGYCLGGGLELAIACDLRVAAETAIFGTPEIDRGWLGGGGASQVLPRLMGFGKAMQMILTGEPIDGRKASPEIGERLAASASQLVAGHAFLDDAFDLPGELGLGLLGVALGRKRKKEPHQPGIETRREITIGRDRQFPLLDQRSMQTGSISIGEYARQQIQSGPPRVRA